MTRSPIVRFVRQTADATASDADLVRRFADTRCNDAFAELVRRYGPMVYGVCRRAVGDHHLTEDAFQAVFVVLARRASHIRPPGAVSGWLFGVARKVAAEASMRKRRRREIPTATLPDRPQPVVEADDSAALVEAAIAELPDLLRAAVLACEIEGLSRKCAAARLGIAEGTLSSRLAVARKRLGDRLRPRTVLTVAVPAALASAAISRADGQAEGTVLQLTQGVLRAMSTTKLRLVPLAVIVVAVALAASAVSASPPDAARERYQIKAPVPKADVKEGKILFWLDEKPQLLAPDGTELDSPDPIRDVFLGVGWGNAQLSPDGKRVAFERNGAERKAAVKPQPGGVVLNKYTNLNILELEGKKELKEFADVEANAFYWMNDGTTLYLRGQEIDSGGAVTEPLLNWTVDTATQKRTLITVPEHCFVRAVSRDGKVALADERKINATEWHEHVHLWTIGTDKPTPLLEKGQSAYRPMPKFSPDGKRLLCKVTEYGTRTPQGNGGWKFDDFKQNNLVVVDLATKKQKVVKELGENPEWRLSGFAWSPDGKRIAYVETKQVPRPPGQRTDSNPFRVMVADTDGKNAKQVYTATGHFLIGFDWR